MNTTTRFQNCSHKVPSTSNNTAVLNAHHTSEVTFWSHKVTFPASWENTVPEHKQNPASVITLCFQQLIWLLNRLWEIILPKNFQLHWCHLNEVSLLAQDKSSYFRVTEPKNNAEQSSKTFWWSALNPATYLHRWRKLTLCFLWCFSHPLKGHVVFSQVNTCLSNNNNKLG